MSKIIRTKTKVTGGITKAEEEAMDKHAKLWIKRAFRTKPIELDKIIPAIEGVYASARLKKPRVVIVPSPLVMAFAYGASAAILYSRPTKTATRAATDAATWDALGAINACFDLAGEFGIKCAGRWQGIYAGGNMWCSSESFLTAYRDILGLDLPEHKKYFYWEQAAIHGGFRVMHKDFCIVSDFPEFIKIDDENRPHCETGPSHRWRDGWSLYHWHGTRIPDEWIEKPEILTAEIALTHKNIEQRRAACEILGWSKILDELDAETIDKDGDPQIGTLLEVQLPDLEGKDRFLRVQCGTGREFVLGVPRNIETAIAAQSWVNGLGQSENKLPKIRT